MDLPKQGKQNGADQGPHEHPGQAEVKMAHQVVEKFGALREAGEDGAGCDEKAMLTGQSDLEDVGGEQGEPKKKKKAKEPGRRRGQERRRRRMPRLSKLKGSAKMSERRMEAVSKIKDEFRLNPARAQRFLDAADRVSKAVLLNIGKTVEEMGPRSMRLLET